MDLRKKAIEYIYFLEKRGIACILATHLKTSASEFLKTTDRGNVPAFLDYLTMTGLLKQISNSGQTIYEINYELKEKLKDPEFTWLVPEMPKEPLEKEETIDEIKALLETQGN